MKINLSYYTTKSGHPVIKCFSKDKNSSYKNIVLDTEKDSLTYKEMQKLMRSERKINTNDIFCALFNRRHRTENSRQCSSELHPKVFDSVKKVLDEMIMMRIKGVNKYSRFKEVYFNQHMVYDRIREAEEIS